MEARLRASSSEDRRLVALVPACDGMQGICDDDMRGAEKAERRSGHKGGRKAGPRDREGGGNRGNRGHVDDGDHTDDFDDSDDDARSAGVHRDSGCCVEPIDGSCPVHDAGDAVVPNV